MNTDSAGQEPRFGLGKNDLPMGGSLVASAQEFVSPSHLCPSVVSSAWFRLRSASRP